MRSRRRGELAEDRAALLRLAAVCAGLARERSQKIIPFSVAARSVSWLMQRVPKRVWAVRLLPTPALFPARSPSHRASVSRPVCFQDERKRKLLVHTNVCHRLLDEMLACRPPPTFQASIFINFVYGDQTYKQRGTTGRAVRVQYMGSNCLPLNIEREVVFNTVHLPVPAALMPQLDAQALATIHQRGVYCGAPFLSILPHLYPGTVQGSLAAFMNQQLQYVSQYALAEGKPVTLLSSAEFMDALVGRPLTDPGGPTYINILPTLRDCNTRSYDDGYKTWEHFLRCLPHTLIWRIGGDGQYNLLMSYLKRKHPERFKYVWIDVGDFHAFAHFMFAINELYWCACLCCFAKQLGRANLQKRIPNLEHNNYTHVLVFLQAVSVAIVVYFTAEVHSPPPALLYSNPAAYFQQINSAGGAVLFKCLQYCGSPVLTYQRSIRSRDGTKLPELHAYAVHLHRAVHKTQEKVIMVIALLSYYCVHPALQLLKTAFCGVSLLGRPGACMAFDRLVEYINLRQSQRNSSFRAFESALHYTPRLLPMLHIDAAYTAAVSGGESGGDAGYDPRMIRDVQLLVAFFVQMLGRDLSVPSAKNPFFHTGNDVDVNAGPAREYRPSEWLWNVESGRSAGNDAAAQSCTAWLLSLLSDHMFPCGF